MLAATNIKAQQNLVYNGDFELYSSCPLTPSYPAQSPNYEITKCLGWTTPTTATSDYENVCGAPQVHIPDNIQGWQYAHSGNGYCGFLAINLPDNWFEYVQGNLTQPLMIGHNYKVSFYVSLGNYAACAVSKIGAYISNTRISRNDTYPFSNYAPQVKNTTGNFLKDTMNWMEISGTYLAQGGENYITIGNFTDTSYTDTLSIQPHANANSYYYIDDVSITDITDTHCANELTTAIPNIFTPNNDNINDLWTITDTCFAINEVEIYNRWGLKVFETNQKQEAWDGHTTSGEPCSEDTYYFIISYTNKRGDKITKNGYLQLMR